MLQSRKSARICAIAIVLCVPIPLVWCQSPSPAPVRLLPAEGERAAPATPGDGLGDRARTSPFRWRDDIATSTPVKGELKRLPQVQPTPPAAGSDALATTRPAPLGPSGTQPTLRISQTPQEARPPAYVPPTPSTESAATPTFTEPWPDRLPPGDGTAQTLQIPSQHHPPVDSSDWPVAPHGGISRSPKPPTLTAWWDSLVAHPAGNRGGARSVTINDLLASALVHSPEVRVISDTPLVRDTAIIEAAAAFDWAAFMETSWADINEPVGSILTTGGPDRFENQLMQYELGFRRQLSTGGRFEVGQRYGYERSNSVFFIPNDQGTSRLTLNYTQPLLRGAGRVYNQSLILIAQIESGIARDDFSRELQGYLLDVTRAYWSLYLERAVLLQRTRLYESGLVILEKLQARQATDAVTNQVVRARAAVASRRSDLIRARAAVKNAEGRIRALVNDPQLGRLDELEITPVDIPTTQEVPLSLPDVIESAVQHRPEVHAVVKQIKASCVRMNLTKNELLPALDLVLETYVAGLRGDSAVGIAWTDQFSAGGASYTAGLQFEVPLQNREAKARFLKRALELRQLQSQLQSTLNALQLEVEIAVREVETSYQEVQARFESMQASRGEVQFIEERWALLPGDDRSAALYLEDLLAAQDRLAIAEFEFANAQVSYNLSLSDLKRANGTLLQCEQIEVNKIEEDGIPSLLLCKGESAATSIGNGFVTPTLPGSGDGPLPGTTTQYGVAPLIPQPLPVTSSPLTPTSLPTGPEMMPQPTWQDTDAAPHFDSEPAFAPY